MPAPSALETTIFDTLQSIAFTAERIRDGLVRTVSAETMSRAGRAPFQVAAFQSGLTCRFLDTVAALLTIYKARQVAATLPLAKSAVGVAATLWQLQQQAQNTLDRDDLGGLERLLQRMHAERDASEQWGHRPDALLEQYVRFVDTHFDSYATDCARLLADERIAWRGTVHLYASESSGSCSLEFTHRLDRFHPAVTNMTRVVDLTAKSFEYTNRLLTWAVPKLCLLDEREAERRARVSSGTASIV